MFRQKGGAPAESFRMLHLHDVRCEVAATIERVAARRRGILPDNSQKVDTVWDERSCVCFVCGDTYDVETDAFGDGCVKYYFPYMLARQEGEDEGE